MKPKLIFGIVPGGNAPLPPPVKKNFILFSKSTRYVEDMIFSPQENDRELFPHFHAGYGDALYASSFAVQTRKIVFSLYRLVTGWLFQDPYAARLELNG